MSIMGKQVWAVVCGALREEFEFYTTIALLCDYRAAGLIDGIVISTWKNELSRIDGIADKLSKLDIHIVELEEIDPSVDQYANINFIRQSYQLSQGMKATPDDVFILKCRTDFSVEWIKRYRTLLESNIDISVEKHGNLSFGISYKISVLGNNNAVPFFLFCDICFLGYKTDLMRISTFEMNILSMGEKIMPDVLFYLNIFINQFPIIREFYSAVDFFAFKRAKLFNWIKKSDIENNGMPGILNKFFALYFIILKCCIYFIFEKRSQCPNVKLSDYFLMKPQNGKDGWGINTEIIRKIVDGEAAFTPGYIKLYKEICKLLSNEYALIQAYTPEDYLETKKWGEQNADIPVEKWLRYNEPKISCGERINYLDSINILFSDYTEDKEKLNNLANVLKSDIESMTNDYRSIFYQPCFYYNLFDDLDKYEKIDKKIYEIVYTSAGRCLDFDLLRDYAKRLDDAEIDEYYIPKIQDYFDKKLIFPYFYTFPMLPNKLSAYYHYAKFSERNGNTKVISRVYNELCKSFLLKNTLTVPGSYADSFIENIKNIVNTSYTEYPTNISVRYMAFFMYDEFENSLFSSEAWEYLKRPLLKNKLCLPFRRGEKDAYDKLINYAEEFKDKWEFEELIMMMLKEKNTSSQQKADLLIKNISEQNEINNIFITANFCENDTILDYAEITDDDSFILLLRILSNKKQLNRRKEELVTLCEDNIYRKIALSMFSRIENDPRVIFFSTKNNKELWMHYRDFIILNDTDNYVIPKNNEGIGWPQSDTASRFPFAAFIRDNSNGLYLSVEFNAVNCERKNKLFDRLEKKDLNKFNSQSYLIRLKTVDYPYMNNVDLAVNKALDEFCRIGEIITRADKIKEI